MTALAIKTRAKAIFSETYHYPATPFRSIGRSCFRWALERAKMEAAHGTDAERFEWEAQKIALNNSIPQIKFEIERRRYGSFAMTLDGAPSRKRVFERALAIAEQKT